MTESRRNLLQIYQSIEVPPLRQTLFLRASPVGEGTDTLQQAGVKAGDTLHLEVYSIRTEVVSIGHAAYTTVGKVKAEYRSVGVYRHSGNTFEEEKKSGER